MYQNWLKDPITVQSGKYGTQVNESVLWSKTYGDLKILAKQFIGSCLPPFSYQIISNS